MQCLHLVAGFPQTLGHLLGHHDTAMLPAGAAEADSEIALSLLDIVRQKVQHEVGDSVQKFLSLREATHKGCDAGIKASLLTKLGHEVRIGKKTHIEDHIRIEGH